MSSFNNIDELLKSSFKDYTPPAPDVWSQVSQQIPSAPSAAGQAAGGKIATAIKSASITTKLITALAIPATFVGAYAGYKYITTDKAPQTITQTEVIARVEQPVVGSTPIAVEVRREDVKPVIEPFSADKPIKDHTRNRRSDDTNANNMKSIISDPPPSEAIGPGVVSQDNTKQDINTKNATEVSTKPVVNPSKSEEARKQLDKNTSEGAKPQPAVESASSMEEDAEPVIPNVFSPDGDGMNDVFMIPIENETQYAIKILDRSGGVVFESNNKNVLWDGVNTKNGQPCETGLYTYTFRYQYKNGRGHVKNGKIQLIR